MHETPYSPFIALVGPPNSGKTALFNALTGSRQKVANYTGVTVERKEGIATAPSGLKFRILDLPGTYSLDAHSPEEIISRDTILGKLEGEPHPDAVIVVVDATNLERTLGLAVEIVELGLPVMLALNMMDLAQKRGLKLDLSSLSDELRLPIVPTVAIKSKGIQELLSTLVGLVPTSRKTDFLQWSIPTEEMIQKRFALIDEILHKATLNPRGPANWTERLDRIILHPLWGNLLLGLVLIFVFQAVFSWAQPLMEGLDSLFNGLKNLANGSLPPGPLRSLISDGIIPGVGTVVIYLPQILLLFFFILLLEESGCMARAAFLMDRTMGAMGLHGRAFIPLISSFACAIPGIMATRTIDNPRDRLTTIMVAPLMPCSARLPVYTLIIGAFIPNTRVWGPLRLQGLVMFGLYIVGILSALLVSFVLKHSLLKGPRPALILEMPTYKLPTLANVARGLYERTKLFLKRAGTFILGVSICLWFLVSYPKPPENTADPAIHHSFAGKMGHFMEPAFREVGFSWEIVTALIPGLAAREVLVSSLATIYSVTQHDNNDESGTQKSLGQRLIGSWSLATALALLMWYVFSPQCLATLAVIRKETQSWRWTLLSFSYMLLLAYGAAFITYRVTSFLIG